MAVAITQAGSDTFTAASTTPSRTGVAIGTAAADRLVFACITYFGGGSADDINSLTIGGVSATRVRRDAINNTDFGAYDCSEIWWAAVPTGTTATIAYNIDANLSNSIVFQCVTYAVTGANTTTPVSSSTTASLSNALTNAVSNTLTVLTDGAALGHAWGAVGDAVSVAWTFLTENFDNDYDIGGIFVGQSTASRAGAATSQSITATFSATGGFSNFRGLTTAAIQPAAGGGGGDGVGSVSGTGTLAGTGASQAATVGSLSGSGTLAGIGRSNAASAGAIDCTGTLTGVGVTAIRSVGSSDGTGTLAGVGASTSAAVGAVSGTGALAGIGASNFAGVGSVSGSGALDGVGVTAFVGAGAITGSAAVAGAGAFSADGQAVGSVSGTGTVAAVGAALSNAVGSVSCAGALNGIGASTFAGVGAISGTGTVAGVGDSQQAGDAVGTVSGTGILTGVGRSIAAAVGSISCAATVSGISPAADRFGGAGAFTPAEIISAKLAQRKFLASLPASKLSIEETQLLVALALQLRQLQGLPPTQEEPEIAEDFEEAIEAALEAPERPKIDPVMSAPLLMEEAPEAFPSLVSEIEELQATLDRMMTARAEAEDDDIEALLLLAA